MEHQIGALSAAGRAKGRLFAATWKICKQANAYGFCTWKQPKSFSFSSGKPTMMPSGHRMLLPLRLLLFIQKYLLLASSPKEIKVGGAKPEA